MIKLTAIVLLLALGLSAPFARGQNRDLGFTVIDHKAFAQLPRSAQHDYLILIMQTVVEFEQALAHAPAAQKSKLKKTVEVLRTFLRELDPIDEAHAAPPSRACLYGGWFSTYEKVNGKDVCRRPNLSSDPKIRRNYNENARCARAGEQACNPEIFGLEANGKPTCVDVARTSDTNISLACLLAFEADPNKQGRLDRMVEKILREQGCADSFNKVVQTIFNTCVCQENAKNDGRNVQIAPQYFDYMRGHRTCYSLIAQTQHIAEALKDRLGSGQACWAINPQNVDILANDLRAVSSYAHANVVMKLPAGQNSSEARLRFLSQYRGPNDSALDNLTDYNNCLDRLRGQDTQCDLVGGASIQARNHCPLELPEVVQTTCAIAVTPGVVADGKLQFEAKLTLSPERDLGDSKVKWKSGDEEKDGGLSFSSSVPATELKGNVQLSATLVLGDKTISCQHSQEHTGTADPTLKECELADVAVTKNDDGSLSFATAASFKPAGAVVETQTWKVGATTVVGELSALRYKVEEGQSAANTVVLTAKSGAVEVSCSKPFEAPKDEEAPRECKVEGVEIAKVEGQENKRKVKASFSGRLIEGDKVSWNINGTTFEMPDGAPVEREIQVDGRAKVIVVARIFGEEVIECTKQEVEEPEAQRQVAAEAKTCTVTIVQAMDDEAKPILDVSITAAGDDAPAEDVKFEGMSFKKTGKASATAAVVRIPRKQTKKIKASYKSVKGENFSCEREVEIPAAEQTAAPGGAPPQQGLPPVQSPPDIFFQGVR